MTVVLRLRRSTGCRKPSLPRVRMLCAFVMGTIVVGAVATVRPTVRQVPLATDWDVESLGAVAPAGLVEGPLWSTWPPWPGWLPVSG